MNKIYLCQITKYNYIPFYLYGSLNLSHFDLHFVTGIVLNNDSVLFDDGKERVYIEIDVVKEVNYKNVPTNIKMNILKYSHNIGKF